MILINQEMEDNISEIMKILLGPLDISTSRLIVYLSQDIIYRHHNLKI